MHKAFIYIRQRLWPVFARWIWQICPSCFDVLSEVGPETMAPTITVKLKCPRYCLWRRNQLQEASGDFLYHQDGTHAHKRRACAAIISSFKGVNSPWDGNSNDQRMRFNYNMDTWTMWHDPNSAAVEAAKESWSWRKYAPAINCIRVQITSFLFMHRGHLSRR